VIISDVREQSSSTRAYPERCAAASGSVKTMAAEVLPDQDAKFSYTAAAVTVPHRRERAGRDVLYPSYDFAHIDWP
jgi:hypothetical protein